MNRHEFFFSLFYASVDHRFLLHMLHCPSRWLVDVLQFLSFAFLFLFRLPIPQQVRRPRASSPLFLPGPPPDMIPPLFIF